MYLRLWPGTWKVITTSPATESAHSRPSRSWEGRGGEGVLIDNGLLGAGDGGEDGDAERGAGICVEGRIGSHYLPSRRFASALHISSGIAGIPTLPESAV
jgi:hypothetical protein